MSSFGLFLAILICLAVLLLMTYAAYTLSLGHSGELYVIFYIFSLFAFVSLPLHAAALASGQEIEDFLGPLKFAYSVLTNTEDEIYFVLGILYLGIGPQILTYVLSGFFGSAALPMFVRQIQTIAILSLVKFMAGLSGIMSGKVLASVYFGRPTAVDTILALVSLYIALWGAFIHYFGNELF
ncbi:hypothetical protein AB8Z38_04595 [Bradyrhizobium sp. LLZ17]|uniref:Uncharacterized protein n=1 Tax=Bradyrhizobium sp. LLZ17 TaxID=3239388 RepID=A0AB39XLH9_9BRAD